MVEIEDARVALALTNLRAVVDVVVADDMAREAVMKGVTQLHMAIASIYDPLRPGTPPKTDTSLSSGSTTTETPSAETASSPSTSSSSPSPSSTPTPLQSLPNSKIGTWPNRDQAVLQTLIEEALKIWHYPEFLSDKGRGAIQREAFFVADRLQQKEWQSTPPSASSPAPTADDPSSSGSASSSARVVISYPAVTTTDDDLAEAWILASKADHPTSSWQAMVNRARRFLDLLDASDGYVRRYLNAVRDTNDSSVSG